MLAQTNVLSICNALLLEIIHSFPSMMHVDETLLPAVNTVVVGVFCSYQYSNDGSIL